MTTAADAVANDPIMRLDIQLDITRHLTDGSDRRQLAE